MKTMKKLASVLLALVMVMALAAPAFADHTVPTDGTITITDAGENASYNAWKIFNVTMSGEVTDGVLAENGNYAYSIADGMKTIVEGYQQGGKAYFTVDNVNNVTWDKNVKLDAEAFATYLRTALANVAATKTTDSHETVEGSGIYVAEFTGLDLGYYFINSTVGTLCILDTTNYNVSIEEKNEKPIITKTATDTDGQEKEATSIGVGSVIPFTVTVHAQKGAKNYVVTDTMTSLKLDVTSFKVKVSGEELENTDNVNYTLNASEKNFTLSFTETYLNDIKVPTDIVITYEATVTADALNVDAHNNVTLNYGNADHTESTTDKVDNKTYEFTIKKTIGDTEDVLQNAQFKLYKEDGTTEVGLIKITDTNGDYYRPVVAGETAAAYVEAGEVVVKGLAAGKYQLKETKAPDGYNLKVDNSQVDIGEGKTNVVTKVANFTGAELPSTGGIGTTIFYVGGGILIAAAGILLITKKRMGKAD